MKIEQLNEKQRAYYEKALALDAAFADEYLDSLGEKRESGVSRKQKLATLEVRFAAATRTYDALEEYRKRVDTVMEQLEQEKVSAREVDLRLHMLPKVPGVVLRLVGKPRGPRVAKDPEEEALKRMNKGDEKRGRPKKVKEEAVPA